MCKWTINTYNTGRIKNRLVPITMIAAVKNRLGVYESRGITVKKHMSLTDADPSLYSIFMIELTDMITATKRAITESRKLMNM